MENKYNYMWLLPIISVVVVYGSAIRTLKGRVEELEKHLNQCSCLEYNEIIEEKRNDT